MRMLFMYCSQPVHLRRMSTDSLSLLCAALSTSPTLTSLSLDYCQLCSDCGGHIGKMAAANSLQ